MKHIARIVIGLGILWAGVQLGEAITQNISSDALAMMLGMGMVLLPMLSTLLLMLSSRRQPLYRGDRYEREQLPEPVAWEVVEQREIEVVRR